MSSSPGLGIFNLRRNWDRVHPMFWLAVILILFLLYKAIIFFGFFNVVVVLFIVFFILWIAYLLAELFDWFG